MIRGQLPGLVEPGARFPGPAESLLAFAQLPSRRRVPRTPPPLAWGQPWARLTGEGTEGRTRVPAGSLFSQGWDLPTAAACGRLDHPPPPPAPRQPASFASRKPVLTPDRSKPFTPGRDRCGHVPRRRRGDVPRGDRAPGIGPSLTGGRKSLSEISDFCVNLACSRDCCSIGDFKPHNASGGADVCLRALLASSFRARLRFAVLTRKPWLGSLVSGEWNEFLKTYGSPVPVPALALKALFPRPSPKPWVPPSVLS